jgi:hypothetical protein
VRFFFYLFAYFVIIDKNSVSFGEESSSSSSFSSSSSSSFSSFSSSFSSFTSPLLKKSYYNIVKASI